MKQNVETLHPRGSDLLRGVRALWGAREEHGRLLPAHFPCLLRLREAAGPYKRPGKLLEATGCGECIC